MPAGVALCLACEKDVQTLPAANTRLGCYARHPEELAKLLLQSTMEDLSTHWCKGFCAHNDDFDCTNELAEGCITRWLVEEVGMDG